MKKNRKKKIRKEQVLCFAAGILLAAASAQFTGTKELVREGEAVMLVRPGYGESAKEQTVLVNGQRIRFTVTERKYTEEEAENILSCLAEALTASESPEQKSVYPGFEGIRAEWSDGENGRICRLTLGTETGTAEKILSFPSSGTSEKKEENDIQFEDRVRKLLEAADACEPGNDIVILPREAGGIPLTYEEEKSSAPVVFLLLGVVSAVLLGRVPAEEQKKKQKERETELSLDYSNVVSKLLIFLGAGLTVRSAFEKLSGDAEGERRAITEELSITVKDMKNGMPEDEALSAFAGRCGLACYLRLASLLERNQKTGGISVRGELELEMQEAFSQRKEAAKRLGEEAGTRLVLPLLMSLAAVLFVTAIPAFLKMNM